MAEGRAGRYRWISLVSRVPLTRTCKRHICQVITGQVVVVQSGAERVKFSPCEWRGGGFPSVPKLTRRDVFEIEAINFRRIVWISLGAVVWSCRITLRGGVVCLTAASAILSRQEEPPVGVGLAVVSSFSAGLAFSDWRWRSCSSRCRCRCRMRRRRRRRVCREFLLLFGPVDVDKEFVSDCASPRSGCLCGAVFDQVAFFFAGKTLGRACFPAAAGSGRRFCIWWLHRSQRCCVAAVGLFLPLATRICDGVVVRGGEVGCAFAAVDAVNVGRLLARGAWNNPSPHWALRIVATGLIAQQSVATAGVDERELSVVRARRVGVIV